MILMGYPNNGPDVRLTVDTSRLVGAMDDAHAATEDFVRYIVGHGRKMLTLDVMLEVIGLTPDQVWARFYVRGAMDPDFAEPDAVDNYLIVLGRIRGDRGHAARTGFLAGWATHRAAAPRLKLVTS